MNVTTEEYITILHDLDERQREATTALWRHIIDAHDLAAILEKQGFEIVTINFDDIDEEASTSGILVSGTDPTIQYIRVNGGERQFDADILALQSVTPVIDTHVLELLDEYCNTLRSIRADACTLPTLGVMKEAFLITIRLYGHARVKVPA